MPLRNLRTVIRRLVLLLWGAICPVIEGRVLPDLQIKSAKHQIVEGREGEDSTLYRSIHFRQW
jgi:hypothetical protein